MQSKRIHRFTRHQKSIKRNHINKLDAILNYTHMEQTTTTRGIRNNNPLNIRQGCNWKGLSKTQTDRQFCQFTNMVYGVRAALVTLQTYNQVYKISSINDIIYRWAPPQDGNATNNYIKRVCKEMNKGLDKEIVPKVTPTTQILTQFAFQQKDYMLYRLLESMCLVESNYELPWGIYRHAIDIM